LEIRKVNIDKDFEEWNDIIINSPDFYTIAHNPSLISFLDNFLGWKGESFFIEKESKVVAVYQHTFTSDSKVVSMPHFSYGGIIRKNDQFSKQEIFKALSKFFPNQFEIREFEPYSKHYDTDKIATFLNLEKTVKEQLAIFKSNHRRKIKKAYKNELEVEISNSKEAILSFYEVYSKNMLRLGSPPLSIKFFNNLSNEYKFGEIKIFVVRYENQVIGGAVVLSYNNFVEDCWLSTLSEYNNLYSSVLLYWEMIKYSIEIEAKYFSFGRSTKDSSLLHFKKQWNPIERQLYFSFSEPQKVSLKKMTFLTKIWKLLPLKIANFVGPKIADKLY
tara:strand:+ start:181 stop:1173 length:993 start_codon:yes stop_codon:yes gene_type:complete